MRDLVNRQPILTSRVPARVAHTHGHGDHRAADAQFAGRPRTTVVGPSQQDVVAHFGFDDWPTTPRALDLGNRTIDVIPAPGHHAAATVFYDRVTGLVLTGDSLYPGRIYVQDWPAFVDSVERLVQWSQEHPVSYVAGCHIEMSADGVDFPRGLTYQPGEPPLQMPASSLLDLHAALRTIDGVPGRYPFDGFQVWNLDDPEAST